MTIQYGVRYEDRKGKTLTLAKYDTPGEAYAAMLDMKVGENRRIVFRHVTDWADSGGDE